MPVAVGRQLERVVGRGERRRAAVAAAAAAARRQPEPAAAAARRQRWQPERRRPRGGAPGPHAPPAAAAAAAAAGRGLCPWLRMTTDRRHFSPPSPPLKSRAHLARARSVRNAPAALQIGWAPASRCPPPSSSCPSYAIGLSNARTHATHPVRQNNPPISSPPPPPLSASLCPPPASFVSPSFWIPLSFPPTKHAPSCLCALALPSPNPNHH